MGNSISQTVVINYQAAGHEEPKKTPSSKVIADLQLELEQQTQNYAGVTWARLVIQGRVSSYPFTIQITKDWSQANISSYLSTNYSFFADDLTLLNGVSSAIYNAGKTDGATPTNSVTGGQSLVVLDSYVKNSGYVVGSAVTLKKASTGRSSLLPLFNIRDAKESNEEHEFKESYTAGLAIDHLTDLGFQVHNLQPLPSASGTASAAAGHHFDVSFFGILRIVGDATILPPHVTADVYLLGVKVGHINSDLTKPIDINVNFGLAKASFKLYIQDRALWVSGKLEVVFPPKTWQFTQKLFSF